MFLGKMKLMASVLLAGLLVTGMGLLLSITAQVSSARTAEPPGRPGAASYQP